MSGHAPPGWGETDALDVLLGRVPGRYGVVRACSYTPDATELHIITIIEGKGQDAPVVFHVEGRKPRVVAELLKWVNGQEGR